MQVTENFTEKELACSHCGALPPWIGEFAQHLEDLREEARMPLPISSGFRCINHEIESDKPFPGEHYYGAVDVLVSGAEAQRLIAVAIQGGWLGIGVQQKGPIAARYIHLDRRAHAALWSY
tara:strand:- start:45 stop:407 length:363 start_codon:yes stop_codon:yes gene_type:complete